MIHNFNYYGGKKIQIDISKTIEEKNCDSDELKIDGLLECKFKNSTKYIYLQDELGSGGEGAVFKTSIDGLVAKIYGNNDSLREEKLLFMINNPIEDERICWPNGVLYYNEVFVGCVMPYIDHNIYDSKFDPRDYSPNESGIDSYYSFFRDDKKNLLRLLINITEIFEVLEKHNIVIGDVNFNNILINKNDYSVKIIDLDGAQIDKYPCVTFKIVNIPPEIACRLNKEEDISEIDILEVAQNQFHNIYSTFHRDRYSLSYYFYSAFLCKSPFNDNELCKHEFKCHPTDKIMIENHLNASRMKIWAHLPIFLRDEFCNCFTTRNPNDRPSPLKWKSMFKYYLNLLERNEINDVECLSIFPKKELDYNFLNIKMVWEDEFVLSGFTMEYIVKKLIKELNKINIKCDINAKQIAEYLKVKTVLKIENITFQLLLNIGVLKKIKAKYRYIYN